MPDALFPEEFLRKIERLSLAVRRREGGGRPRDDRRGGRLEFAAPRAYTPGDDLRYVDWHLFGRLGRLFLKEFAREEEAAVLLVLDVSASMAAKLRGALRLAAALGTIALARGDRFRLAFAKSGVLDVSRPLSGDGRRGEMLEELARRGAEAGGATDLDASLSRLPPHRGAGRRAVLLVSDLLAERDGRRHLGRLRGDTVVLHWLSREERAPDAAGRVRLVGAEGGEIEAWVGDAEAARYREEAERWCAGLRSYLGRRGVRCLLAPAEEPVEDLVLDVLVAGGVLR